MNANVSFTQVTKRVENTTTTSKTEILTVLHLHTQSPHSGPHSHPREIHLDLGAIFTHRQGGNI